MADTSNNTRQANIQKLIDAKIAGELGPNGEGFYRRAVSRGEITPEQVFEIEQAIARRQAKKDIGGLLGFAAREGPSALGATAGAALGGGTPLSIPLAAVGAAGGEAGGQLLRRLGLPVGRNVESSGEAATSIAEAGVAGAVGEGAFQGAARLGKKFLKTPDVPVHLTQAETTGGRVATLAEGVTERSLPGAIVMAPFRRLQQIELRQMGQNIVQAFQKGELSAQEAGELFLRELNNSKVRFNLRKDELYGVVEELSGTKSVPTILKQRVDTGLVDAQGKPLFLTKSRAGVKKVSPAPVKTDSLKKAAQSLKDELDEAVFTPPSERPELEILNRIVNGPDTVTFSGARLDRSRLLAILRKNKELLGDKGTRIAATLEGELDEALVRAAEDSGVQGLREAVDTANSFFKENVKDFKSDIIRRLLRKKRLGRTDQVVQEIFNKGSSEDIEIIKRLVPDTSFTRLKRNWLLSVIDQATTGEPLLPTLDKVTRTFGFPAKREPVLNFTKLNNTFERIGQEKLSKVFDPIELTRLNEFLEVANRVGRAQERGFLPGLIAWTANGFILAPVLGFGSVGTAATISIGLAGSAKLLSSSNGLKALTRALLEKPGTQAANRLAIQLQVMALKPEPPRRLGRQEPVEQDDESQ